MKRIILAIAILATLAVLLSACEGFDPSMIGEKDINKVIKCESPYIRFSTGCCLDKNNDSVCDNDEIKPVTCKNITVPYEDTEEYFAKETYLVRSPYTEEECRNITVPYEQNVCEDKKVPYEVMEEKTKTLFDLKDKTISGEGRLAIKKTLKTDTLVQVSFKADDTLNLFAFDDDEFQKIIDNPFYVSNDYLMAKKGVSNADSSFKTTGEDEYIIYLKNTHLFSKVKVYNFKATSTYKEKVTKYKTEKECHKENKTTTKQTCESVTKYKEETKTRNTKKTRPVVKYRTETVCE